ncbi:beta-defensin 115 isoform X1 [Microtus oregoni]|uniref:beta-defensin 115 isoform X1 n=1 Tax=Microtus oregoni TaxID=111838 RepID=UPI001BB1E90D|nr:beta-defensin 115 isoform X1 [Microtus oregoni]
MLLTRSSALSGHIKFWFLTLAVLVVLAQTSPDGWLRTCYYGMGKCRYECRTTEKKKERCGDLTFCCIQIAKSKLYHLPPVKDQSKKGISAYAVVKFTWNPRTLADAESEQATWGRHSHV